MQRHLDQAHGRGHVLGGKYLLGDVLGTGGMAIVYAAVQPSLGRTVAIKVLRPELEANPYVVCRFRNEAVAASRLTHPNIAGVIDFERALDGTYYLVMEYVQGPRLAELIGRNGRPALHRSAALCSQLLTALAEVHATGIVHADVKSDNVLVELLRDGRELAKLIDFGLARFSDEIAVTTDRSLLAGTPEYLAPEVIRGEPASVASDLYAMGVVLYELITGTTPFAGGASAEILARHLSEDVVPPSLRCVDRDVPPALDRVVLRALEKSPANRFASAAAFADALAHATRGLEEVGREAPPPPASPGLSTEATTRDWMTPESCVDRPRFALGTAPHEALRAPTAQIEVSRPSIRKLEHRPSFAGPTTGDPQPASVARTRSVA